MQVRWVIGICSRVWVYGQWNKCEQVRSSTWRELAAVARVLEAVVIKLANYRVKWLTDNENVACTISVGSRVPELQAVAIRILIWHCNT